MMCKGADLSSLSLCLQKATFDQLELESVTDEKDLDNCLPRCVSPPAC